MLPGIRARAQRRKLSRLCERIKEIKAEIRAHEVCLGRRRGELAELVVQARELSKDAN